MPRLGDSVLHPVLAGIVSALAVSFVLRKVFWRSAVEPFIMELPTYKAPEFKNVARNLWQRAEIFLRRAGGIILTMSVIIWVLSTFPGPPPGAVTLVPPASQPGRQHP